MNQMVVAAFGDTLCLADLDPIGGFVTGSLESILLNKGLQQIKRMMIDCYPVIGD
jgi:hypothetical protein